MLDCTTPGKGGGRLWGLVQSRRDRRRPYFCVDATTPHQRSFSPPSHPLSPHATFLLPRSLPPLCRSSHSGRSSLDQEQRCWASEAPPQPPPAGAPLLPPATSTASAPLHRRSSVSNPCDIAELLARTQLLAPANTAASSVSISSAASASSASGLLAAASSLAAQDCGSQAVAVKWVPVLPGSISARKAHHGQVTLKACLPARLPACLPACPPAYPSACAFHRPAPPGAGCGGGGAGSDAGGGDTHGVGSFELRHCTATSNSSLGNKKAHMSTCFAY